MKCNRCGAEYDTEIPMHCLKEGVRHDWVAEVPPSRNSAPSLQVTKEELKKLVKESDDAYNEHKKGKVYRTDYVGDDLEEDLKELKRLSDMNYEMIGADIGRLVTKKQAAYGDSFGKAGQIMAILYPAGIPPEKLDDALTIVRVIDKLFRIATDRDALGESPWRDVAGYALLEIRKSLARNQIK